MMFFLLRNSAVIVSAATIALAIPVAHVNVAAAQQTQTGQPAAPEWDDRVKRFYGRGDTQREIDGATRRLYEDPLHKHGAPENRLDDPRTPDSASGAPHFDSGVRRLDDNRDGAISRQEYFQGRSRMVAPGLRGDDRLRRQQERLNSQFRDADRNRDGKVTPDELRRGSRF